MSSIPYGQREPASPALRYVADRIAQEMDPAGGEDLQVWDTADFLKAEDEGYWVQAWIWVPIETAKANNVED